MIDESPANALKALLNDERLELAYECPRCAADGFLVDQTNVLEETACQRCTGSFLPQAGFRMLILEIVRMPAEPLKDMIGRAEFADVRCPACQAEMHKLVFDKYPTALCTECRSLWLEPGSLYGLSKGRFGTPGPADPEMEAARRRAFKLERRLRMVKRLALGWVLALSIIGGVHVVLAEVRKRRANKLLEQYGVGGRPLKWWAGRLTELADKKDPTSERLYGITKKRAVANGLIVHEDSLGVSVEPSEELTSQVVERLAKE